MRINNNRGVAELVVVLAVAIAFLGGFIFSPIMKGFTGLGDGKKSSQKQVSSTTVKYVPVTNKLTGETILLQEGTWQKSSEDIVDVPKMSLWERLWALPRLWLILMILGLFFPGIAAIMAKINGGLKTGITQIVEGLESAFKKVNNPEVEAKIKDELSKVYDNSTKRTVSTIKNNK